MPDQGVTVGISGQDAERSERGGGEQCLREDPSSFVLDDGCSGEASADATARGAASGPILRYRDGLRNLMLSLQDPPGLAEAREEGWYAPPHLGVERTLDVLVVDDVGLTRRLLRALIEREGHSVRTARDGKGALRAVRRRTPDLVLMDVRMPRLDGLEATRRIRSLGGRAANVPVIALTASGSPLEIGICLEAGMDDHMAKPASTIELRSLLDLYSSFRRGHRIYVPFGGKTMCDGLRESRAS